MPWVFLGQRITAKLCRGCAASLRGRLADEPLNWRAIAGEDRRCSGTKSVASSQFPVASFLNRFYSLGLARIRTGISPVPTEIIDCFANRYQNQPVRRILRSLKVHGWDEKSRKGLMIDIILGLRRGRFNIISPTIGAFA